MPSVCLPSPYLYIVWFLVPGAYSLRIDPDVDDGRLAGLGDRSRAPAAVPARSSRPRAPPRRSRPHLRRSSRTCMSPSLLPTLPRSGAVLGDLAVADLVHRRVVADHRDVRRAEAVGRLHVEGGHAEGAVAVVAQHFLVRDARAWRPCAKPVPTPSEPSAPGSIQLPGRARPHGLRRDRHHVAAVADVDRVVGEELVDLVGHAIGMDRRLVRQEQRHQLLERGVLGVAQQLHPLLARLALVVLQPAARGLQHRAAAPRPDRRRCRRSTSRFLPTMW